MKLFKSKKLKSILMAAAAVVSLWGTTGIAFAQTAECDQLKKQIEAGGFNVNSLPVYCTTESVYNKFINGALYAVGIAAVIAIVYGGYLYMTAGSNAEQAKKGRTVLTWAIVGLVIVIIAGLLVNVVINLLVENKFV